MFASMQTKAKDEKGKEPEKKEGKESTFSAPCTIGGSEGVDNEKETKEEETKEEGTKEEGKSQGKEKKKTEKKKTENKKLEYSEGFFFLFLPSLPTFFFTISPPIPHR